MHVAAAGRDERTGRSVAKKRIKRVAACFAALVLMFTEYWLLNFCAFPLFDAVSPWTREISAAAGGIGLIVMAIVARWKPGLLKKHLFPGIFATLVAGAILTLAGLYLDSFFVLAAGASVITIGISLAAVLVGVACMGLDLRTLGIGIAFAYFASYALRILFPLLPIEANLLLFVALPFVTLALCASSARPVLRQILAADPPADAAVTSPASYLPFVHQVFVTLIIFRFIYGYTLTFAETDRVPIFPLLALLPLGVYALVRLARKQPLDPDALFRVSILFSIAGFLVPSIAGTQNDLIASNLLSSGTGLFEILMYFVLVALAAKNVANALVVLTWGTAMASLGTIIGANFGRLANQYYHIDYGVIATVSACIVFGLVVYILATQRNFSFGDTIRKVEPAAPLSPSERPADFEQRCRLLSEAHGLTAREDEIFSLLAQGRNARFIQEKLVVSYNTVKTHVSHIYAKLDVHTHQELIDLVEGRHDTA
ncbi:helix-turn-helix transcriptional regulator [Raoultibacter phocaeensis]|uniref:helix-turn-helix transcriptional regulator n=1 Tax=Raoultibacter phocaeensis TaxID=2479841 RepID=UPI00111B7DDE|nr:helix-turn-helix transcriptional regulator [Raoultibacter phocaeensis]